MKVLYGYSTIADCVGTWKRTEGQQMPIAELVKKSAVKAMVNGDEKSMSSKSYPILNGKVADMIGQASARAWANGRKTIMPQDL